LLSVNIIGNAFALIYFKSITAVAFFSILATLTGIIMGWSFLGKRVEVNFTFSSVNRLLKMAGK
jgi:hypothetical protein